MMESVSGVNHNVCFTAGLYQAIRSMICVSLFVASWFTVVGAFQSSLTTFVLKMVCSLSEEIT